MPLSQAALRRFVSSARGGIGLASPARGGIGLASPARGGIVLASSPRGGIGLASSSRSVIGLSSSARGGIGLASSARGGIGLTSSARDGIGALSTPRGGMVSFPAAGSFRGFSSSSFKWNSWESYKKYTPSKETKTACGLLGGLSALCYFVSTGYSWVLDQSVCTSKQYVDKRLEDFKAFKNVATGVHQDFVRQYNEAAREMNWEIAELRSRLLALEQKEFEHRKSLLLADELLRKHQAEKDAAAAKDPSSQ